MKEHGSIYLSSEIQRRLQQDESYLQDLARILEHNTHFLHSWLELISYDGLNPEEQTKDNIRSFSEGNPHTVRQYPTRQGRIYIEVRASTRRTEILKRQYYVADVYIYSAIEYEHHRQETAFISFEEYMRNDSNTTNNE